MTHQPRGKTLVGLPANPPTGETPVPHPGGQRCVGSFEGSGCFKSEEVTDPTAQELHTVRRTAVRVPRSVRGQQSVEFGWYGRFHLPRGSRVRIGKPNSRRVKSEPIGASVSHAPVEVIPNDWKPDGGQVGADLVGDAGPDGDLEFGPPWAVRHGLEFRDGGKPTQIGGRIHHHKHSASVVGIVRQRVGDFPGFVHPAFDDGHVAFDDLMVSKLGTQGLPRGRGARDKHDPRRSGIQSV